MDSIAKVEAILATNTSTLDVNEIASVTKRPQSVVGTHFFSPANVMRLLEVVRGASTSNSVLATTMNLGKKINKVSVCVGVCDGFVGNTIMKFAEGCFSTFSEMIREKIMAKTRYKIGAGMIKPALDEIRNKFDFEEHGGTPFLGVNGISISCHGASTAKAIMNSVFLAERLIKENLINDISIGIDDHIGVMS